MNILCVTPFYEPEGGGLERYAHEVLRRLAANGHEVLVLSSTRLGLGDEDRQGVQVRRRSPRLFLGNSPIDPSLPGDCKRAIRSFAPDVVLGHTPVPFPAEMAYRAARGQGVPFVLTYHAGRLRGSNFALEGLAHLDRWTLQRAMLSGSKGLIAASPFVRDAALGRHRDRVSVVPPGVDTEFFTPGVREGHAQRVLFVGPLSRSYQWKGVDVLWQAFKRIQRRFPQAELTLVGDGERRERFIRRAKKEGIRLRAPGRVGPGALRDEYRRATLTVLPSTSDAESFGMVLAEANACARPVVASDIGGIPDFVRHRDNGLLAKPGDVQDLEHRITQVLLDPAQADEMGRRGRERVIKEHDWDVLSRRTLGVLEQAAAGT